MFAGRIDLSRFPATGLCDGKTGCVPGLGGADSDASIVMRSTASASPGVSTLSAKPATRPHRSTDTVQPTPRSRQSSTVTVSLGFRSRPPRLMDLTTVLTIYNIHYTSLTNNVKLTKFSEK